MELVKQTRFIQVNGEKLSVTVLIEAPKETEKLSNVIGRINDICADSANKIESLLKDESK